MNGGAAIRTRLSRSKSSIVAALLLFAATATVVWMERRIRPPFGAVAQYYAQTDWSGPVRVRTIDPDLTTRRLEYNWPWATEPFSVRWDAWFLAGEAATYRFASSSDDGSAILVDGAVVVDNGGRHEGRMVVGERDLARGLHKLRVEYFQAGGAKEIDVLWAPPGKPLRSLTGPELLAIAPPESVLQSWDRLRKARNILAILTTLVYFTGGVALVVLGPIRAIVRREMADELSPGIRALLAVVALVFLVGLWWGLPGPGWAADELVPDDYATAFDERFANGWWSKYPPGQYQLVIAASLPLWLLRASDPTTYADHWGELSVFLVARVLSTLMALGAVLMVYLCGRRLVAHQAALFSAALFGLSPLLVYYAKVANLDAPYLFWYGIALLAFLRLYDDASSGRDVWLYALAATLAVCTKDQAYGLFVLPSIAIVWRQWQQTSTLNLRGLALAIAIAGAVFALSHNLLFNLSGFLEHVRGISGSQSQPFRVFEPGVTGQWAMLTMSVRLLVLAVGLPAFVLAVVGAAVALAGRPVEGVRRGEVWWVTLSPLSYYLTFIAIVGYTYDRFLLPVVLTLTLFAGAGAAALLARGPAVRRVAIVAIALAIGLVSMRAVLVDLAMLRDSRYQVEDWMSAHAEPGETVAEVGLTEFLPRLDEFRVVRFVLPGRDEIAALRAKHLILNAEYARRFAPGTPAYAAYEQLVQGTGEYRVMAEIRARLPLESFSYHAALRGAESFSNVSKINPAMLVLERVAR